MATVKGKGTTLKVTIGGTLTTIPQVTDITPPAYSVDKIDTTDLSSTVMTSDSTIADPGVVSFTVNYDPADTEHNALHALSEAGTVVACEVLPPTGNKKFTFNAFVSQWSPQSVNVKGLHKVSCSLQPTGAVTIASV